MTIPRSLALAGAAVLALAPLSAAALPAAAAPRSAPTIELFSGTTTFTAGGHTWALGIAGFGGTATITLSTPGENDLWTFLKIPASDLKANAKTGHATFSTGNSLKPVASVALTFTPAKATKQACKSGSETVFSGQVTGSVTLAASASVTFKSAHVSFSSPFLSVDHACLARTSGPTKCFGGFWSAGSAVEAIGETPGLAPEALTIAIDKTIALKSPPNATLKITVTGSESKPSVNRKNKTLQVKASSGPVTGSALLTATANPVVHTATCTYQGKHFTSSDSEYFARYASPAGHLLAGHSIIAGRIGPARQGLSIFDIFTFKKA